MSADNWDMCPRCKKEELLSFENKQKKLKTATVKYQQLSTCKKLKILQNLKQILGLDKNR